MINTFSKKFNESLTLSKSSTLRKRLIQTNKYIVKSYRIVQNFGYTKQIMCSHQLILQSAQKGACEQQSRIQCTIRKRARIRHIPRDSHALTNKEKALATSNAATVSACAPRYVSQGRHVRLKRPTYIAVASCTIGSQHESSRTQKQDDQVPMFCRATTPSSFLCAQASLID